MDQNSVGYLQVCQRKIDGGRKRTFAFHFGGGLNKYSIVTRK